MGTTAQKLEYLGTTKSQLKDQINYGLPTEKQITNQTTFRNYVSSIFEAFLEALRNPDTLFTNLPKTSGSGSNITLNNTANAPMRITLNPTAISQRNIPSEYTQVDYIESSGTQYINTGYTPQIGDQFEFKNVSSDYDGALFSAGTGDYQLILLKSGAWFFKYFSTGNAMGVNKTIDNTNIKINSSGTLYFNEEWEGVVSPVSAVNTSLHLFERANGQAKTIAQMGEIIISNSNNVIQRHYIPCYRNRDNVVGYYEKINGTFLTTEVGSFTYGAVATPTPDSPQDIHTISGNNSVVVEGKNLAFTNWASDFVSRINNSTLAKLETYDGKNCLAFYPSAGNGDYDNKYMFKPIGGFKENTQYTFKIDKYSTSSFGDLDIAYTDGTVTEIRELTSNSWNSIVKTSTANKTIKYLKARWRNNAFQYIDLDTFMVYEGTEDTTYEPYKSNTAILNLGDIEYCKIGDYEDKFVRSGGEQLFDKDSQDILENVRIGADGGNNADNGYFISEFIEVAPNTTYTKNTTADAYHRFAFYTDKSTSSFISKSEDNAITTPSNAKYLRICGLITEKNSIMLNKGTTALPYVPYEKGWYYKQGIGKVVLDGTEASWVKEDTYQGISQFSVLASDVLYTNDTIVRTLSNYFKGIPYRNSWQVDYSITSSYTNHLRIMTSDYSTLADFKTWLSTHNTIVYYVLATPTYTKITGELAQELEEIYKGMLSYDGTTNISQVNNDLAFVINASGILGE